MNYEDVQKSIDETKKEYINKDITVEINVNQYGMYVITLKIKNKNTIFNKIRVFFKKRKQNTEYQSFYILHFHIEKVFLLKIPKKFFFDLPTYFLLLTIFSIT